MEGVKAVAARASMKRYRNIAILATAVILTIVVPWELKVAAPFKILPSEESVVTAVTQGLVVDIKVREGDTVHKGQLLARVSDFERNDLAKHYLGDLQTAKEQLKVMLSGTRQESIAVQEALLQGKKVDLANVRRNKSQRALLEANLQERKIALIRAKQEFDRGKESLGNGLIPRNEFEKFENTEKMATEAVHTAEEALNAFDEKADNDANRIAQEITEQEKNLELMKAGNRPEEIQKAEAEVRRLEGVVDNISSDLKNSDIVARIDGTVVTEYVERRIGTYLEAGGELMRLVNTSTVVAEMMVPEREMGDVHKGLPIRIQLASFPTRYFEGKVDFIAERAHAGDGQQVMTVRSTLANPDGVLKPELTGFAKIYCGPRRIIEVMTRRIGMWFRMEIWALWP